MYDEEKPPFAARRDMKEDGGENDDDMVVPGIRTPLLYSGLEVPPPPPMDTPTPPLDLILDPPLTTDLSRSLA